MQLTAQSVLSLAPDDASAKAAKGLLSPSKWGTSLGFSDRAVWGACQGSGSKPYQTQVDITGPAPSFKCSCPSRKFPCKHGLALMLLKADSGPLFSCGGEPAWVSDWLDSRQDRAQKKQDKVEALANDPKAAAAALAASAKREEGRWKKIESGSDDLGRFLADQIAQGLASLGPEKLEAWDKMASRMVDAQAPGLGELLRRAAGLVNTGADWPEAVLGLMGRMQLCVDAVKNRQQLPGPLLCDLKAALGWAADSDDAKTSTLQVQDDWLVVGCIAQLRESNLTERRVWLHGAQSNRRALILEYSHSGRGFETPWTPGQNVKTTLGFYPGSSPQRAVLCAPLEEAPERTLAGFSSESEWQVAADQLSANPFAPLSLLMLSSVTCVKRNQTWWLHFMHGATQGSIPMEIHSEAAWDLFSMTGGSNTSVAGEWNGQTFRPTCAFSPDGWLIFERAAA